MSNKIRHSFSHLSKRGGFGLCEHEEGCEDMLLKSRFVI